MAPRSNPLAGQVEALVFDVFGTVVDWLGPVSREIHRRAANCNVQLSEEREFLRFITNLPPERPPEECLLYLRGGRLREAMEARVRGDDVSSLGTGCGGTLECGRAASTGE